MRERSCAFQKLFNFLLPFFNFKIKIQKTNITTININETESKTHQNIQQIIRHKATCQKQHTLLNNHNNKLNKTEQQAD
jgi:hypothetical protein